MKTKIIVLLLSAVALILAACSQGTSSAEEPKVLRLGHIQSESNAWHKGSVRFAELVSEKTNGAVKVEVYPSSTLGSDRDLVEGMQIGSVDFALVAGVMSNFYEPYSILELPYLFEDLEHLEAFVYGENGKRLQEEMLEETGVRGLEFWLRGPRELTTNKLVESPSDLRGVKIRVPNIEASVEGWTAMGASPTPMNFGEVYSSLQTGVIDAQENPIAFTTSARIHEVQDYLVKTDHVFGYVQLLMSEKAFEELTEKEKEAVLEAAEEARNYQNEIVFQEEEEALQDMLDQGVEVIEVDQEPFREAIQEVNEELADKYGRELYDTIQEMRE
ncbi:C4-dicarboxylate ABC transporter substrate-binding protein [Oceanobacillus sp. E9]|uniref:C4-dicarboxylate ABC transporter substrate-binding protein n=1 Tax=Oceanobacillus kimchii TaxID=746691 RepID=A0ABQ5TQN4_9BACI|nr:MULTISPECIES: TRAP transporter substrate-binding protein [Oceanobacillus]MBT2599741.1 TRAP transporter substrate-binding protein [Oceanobacillus sp. ISL-74]OEH56284.1 C4-dicarboxylate ABC transporter substrate-binding protein [Oceanobacillus sp. E9]GLO67969.1 C4-dicarboxylate ABC transporter substrate-binding protein [Oceanobacillus kimchii]